MDAINRILGQVPPAVRDNGTARERLEAIWRALGFSRSGLQTRVAGDLAERWAARHQSPRLPVDDPRAAQKRLDRCLNGEVAMPLDLAMDLIEVLPAEYRAAAVMLVFPAAAPAPAVSGLAAALDVNAEADVVTDLNRYVLAKTGGKGMSADQLEAMAISYETEAETCVALAREIRAKGTARTGGAS
ncbi:hypothetical protein [Isoalcanivorax beigongshangi]|uniref:Uncharacterized protein n=1 Tax=Isoalcanivorax beigongshangi TaxID=3238810 RepID=A0ABV4AFG2_9GAMM